MNTLSPANKKFCRRLALVAFPEYRGRKIRVEIAAEYRMESYWDGGSRRDCRAVDLTTGKVAPPVPAATNPMNPQAHAVVRIPSGIAIVEHQIFCGQDAGITIYLTQENDKVLTFCSDMFLRVWAAPSDGGRKTLAQHLAPRALAEVA